MQLPEKTFLKKHCQLSESDFEFCRQVKTLRVFQLLQDVATDHAQQLGFGWHAMDSKGMLWVVSKMKVVFHQPVTRDTPQFDLYTWPLAPGKFYSERCFVATDGNSQLFSATSLWSVISREQRKILSADALIRFPGGCSSAHCDANPDFARVRLDDGFALSYEKTIRRSDLDLNGHVNHTNYVTYALDVLDPLDEVREVQIVYHRELKVGDVVQIHFKRQDDTVFVVGQRLGETCFTTVIRL